MITYALSRAGEQLSFSNSISNKNCSPKYGPFKKGTGKERICNRRVTVATNRQMAHGKRWQPSVREPGAPPPTRASPSPSFLRFAPCSPGDPPGLDARFLGLAGQAGGS